MGSFRLSFVFYGIGIAGLLFASGRTYYRLWKLKKEREMDAPHLRKRKGLGYLSDKND
jgi:hypothetical protein